MSAPSSSLFDLPLAAAYDSARWSKAALDVWIGSNSASAAITAQRERRLLARIHRATLDEWRRFERWLAPLEESLGDAIDRWDHKPKGRR